MASKEHEKEETTQEIKNHVPKSVSFQEAGGSDERTVEDGSKKKNLDTDTQTDTAPEKDAIPVNKSAYDFVAPKKYVAPDDDEWNCCEGIGRKLPCEPTKASSHCCLKFTFIIFFAIVILGCVIVSKTTLLFTATQMNPYVKIKRSAINESIDPNSCAVPVCIVTEDHECSQKESVRWVWCMYFIQCSAYLIMSFRCLLKMCFKKERKPHFKKLLYVLLFDTVYTCGMFILLYTLLPFVDVFIGVMMLSTVALIPSILQIMCGTDILTNLVNTIAMIGQLITPWLLLGLPLLNTVSDNPSWESVCELNNRNLHSYQYQNQLLNNSLSNETGYMISSTEAIAITTITLRPVISYNFTEAGVLPVETTDIWKAVAVILISVIYWENFTNLKLYIPRTGNWLNDLHKELVQRNAFTYFIVGIYRSCLTFILLLMYYGINNTINLNMLFDTNNLYDNKCNVVSDTSTSYFHSDWLEVAAVQISVGILCFFISDLAIKGDIQVQSFTIPLVLMATPVCYIIMFWPCADCNNSFDIGTTFYWNCNAGLEDAYENILSTMSFIGIFGIVSFGWITRHLWKPANRKLTQTEKIFSWPFPCGALLEQSLMLLRRSNDGEFNNGKGTSRSLSKVYANKEEMQKDTTVTERKAELTKPYVPTLRHKKKRGNTFIYFCATMWHETKIEMLQLLISIFRMNNDQVCRNIMKSRYRAGITDYYEFEVHIFFDDAFQLDEESGENHINEYVADFISLVDEAATKVLNVEYKTNKPDRYDTAYGGKLEWTMPFKKNKIILHLKDKDKIRKGKRWSQIMYMHYILGQCIKSHEDKVNEDTLADVAENTYIMALDGDVDFTPESVILLLDLMKSNHMVAATCGRIHPIGYGPMVWYQKFEYSISHWLQKATEHVLGCVLCSPGCFSLFRASALMEVVKTYQAQARQPKECVQYDQGEDRWLCTLLLQNGYRVEYCAAADAYTYAPESFDEFFKQRKRWITSTFANLIDLLGSGKTTAKNNNSISYLYIIYQAICFVSSIIGPGTLFLMIVSTVDFMINIDGQKISFGWILLIMITPFVAFMLVCFFGKKQTQLTFAAILSTVFAIIQVMVLVGLISEVVREGLCSPSALLLIFVLGSFILAAILHPTEFMNIVHLFMFYLFVPASYLLLIIYAICNVNDVSWGTRESIKVEKGNTVKSTQKEKKYSTWTQKMMSTFTPVQSSSTSDQSGCSFSCKPLFGCRCCISPGESEGEQKMTNVEVQMCALGQEMMELKEGINTMNNIKGMKKEKKRLKRQAAKERRSEGDHLDGARKRHSKKSIKDKPKDSTENPEMYESPGLKNIEEQNHVKDESNGAHSSNQEEQQHQDAKSHIIAMKNEEDEHQNKEKFKFEQYPKGTIDKDSKEMEFWDKLVKDNLYPVVVSDDEKGRLNLGLRELRNKSVFAFFIINLIVIALVLGLKLVDLTITIECEGQNKSQIDPVGIAFIFVFGFILALQVLGMLIHRLYTVVQIVSNTMLCISKAEVDDEGKRKAIKDENLLHDLKSSLFNGLEDDEQMELIKQRKKEPIGENAATKSILKRKSQVFTHEELTGRLVSRVKALEDAAEDELYLEDGQPKARASIFIEDNKVLINKLKKRSSLSVERSTSMSKSVPNNKHRETNLYGRSKSLSHTIARPSKDTEELDSPRFESKSIDGVPHNKHRGTNLDVRSKSLSHTIAGPSKDTEELDSPRFDDIKQNTEDASV